MDLIEKTGVQVSALRAGHIDLSNSAGTVTARILGAMARMESEQMGERIKSRLAANSKAGRPSGGPRPFGYKRVGGRLVFDPGVLARCCPAGLPSHWHAARRRWASGRVASTASTPSMTPPAGSTPIASR